MLKRLVIAVGVSVLALSVVSTGASATSTHHKGGTDWAAHWAKKNADWEAHWAKKREAWQAHHAAWMAAWEAHWAAKKAKHGM